MASKKRKVASEDDDMDDEEPSEKPKAKITLDPNDYSLQFFCNLACWYQPLEKTTKAMPWIDKKSWTKSFSQKFLHYETEEDFIDLRNPFTKESEFSFQNELVAKVKKRKEGRKKTRKQYSKDDGVDLTNPLGQAQEPEEDDDVESDEDDFLDSYGNVIDPSQGSQSWKTSGKFEDANKQCALPSSASRLSPEKANVRSMAPDKSSVQEKKKTMYPPPEYKDLDNMVDSADSSTKSSLILNHNDFDFQLLEPKHSILDQSEQMTLLKLMEKFLSPNFDGATMNDSAHQENQLYQSLRLLIKEEQEEFQSFTRSLFFKEEFLKRLSVLKPDVRRYVEECYEHRLNLVHKYPKIFEPYVQDTDSMIRLLPQGTTNQYEMRFEQTLVELGNIAKVVLQNPSRLADPKMPKICVSTKYDILAGKVPPKPARMGIQTTFNKLPVSQDPNAELLAQKTNPSIVISMKALKCLFDNFGPKYDRVWEIPFIVRVYPNGSRVVFVDKPLPPKTLSAQDKNAWFIKVASKCFTLHGWNQSKEAQNDHYQLATDSTEDIFTDAASDDLETFGNSAMIRNTKPVGSQLDGADTGSSSEDELRINECGTNTDSDDKMDQVEQSPSPIRRSRRISAKNKPEVLAPNQSKPVEDEAASNPCKGDERMSQEKLLEKTTTEPSTLTDILKNMKAYKKRASSQKNVLGDIMSAQTDFLRKDSKVKVTGATLDIEGSMQEYKGEFLKRTNIGQVQDYCPPSDGKNVSYRLWNLWNKSDPGKSILKILIRSSTHGVRREHSPLIGVKGPLMQRYSLSSKLEYQTQFGASVMTRSEIAKEWIATLARPDSGLVRIRTDALTYNVLLTERKLLKHLTKEGISVDFRPGEQLGVLHTIFSSLKAIAEPGQYLMRHDGKTGAFVRVFKASKEGENSPHCYNLHDNFAVKAHEDAQLNVQFNPIDTNKVTPLHLHQKRVPGIFSPKPGSSNSGRGRGKKKGRGGPRGRGRGRGRGK
ncbi:hypothetical protein TCAL_01867 [Tigriopus californicus]|uniref:Little elongation complex subunit 2 C-terminal domain-containing protein n=2 Tax=Tigriopus californicus TaxID=6832 RepID=A0A553P7G1_TIGCA|nr:hypothetical protein TCAL_01867 [Tigriopus californicus]|eukprot:TCALIF_01867-PA protein Name:"Similar to Narg2 NMDA receptor-regulated protein 2 (Mus musculus)" AED:0.15 eAED:0.15 QI:15/1/1/1/1/1/3/48/990